MKASIVLPTLAPYFIFLHIWTDREWIWLNFHWETLYSRKRIKGMSMSIKQKRSAFHRKLWFKWSEQQKEKKTGDSSSPPEGLSTAFQGDLSRCLLSPSCSDIHESLRLQQRFLSPSASLARLSLPPSLPPWASALSYSFSQLLNYSSHWNLHDQKTALLRSSLQPRITWSRAAGPRAPAAEPPGSRGRAGGAPLPLASRRASPRDPAQPGRPAAPMPVFRSRDGKSQATARGNWERGEVAAVAALQDVGVKTRAPLGSPARSVLTACLREGSRGPAALPRRCHPGSITVNSLLWKMVNKDMNGFPVKKCSAFQFFKKRVRTGFVCFFCFLLFSEMLLMTGLA